MIQLTQESLTKLFKKNSEFFEDIEIDQYQGAFKMTIYISGHAFYLDCTQETFLKELKILIKRLEQENKSTEDDYFAINTATDCFKKVINNFKN